MNMYPNLFPESALSKASGSEVAIENGNATINAVDYPVVSLNLYGKSVQDTSTGGEAVGKNLFNFEAWKSTVNIKGGSAKYAKNAIQLTATESDCFTRGHGDSNYTAPTYQFKIEPDTQYTLSWASDNDNNGYVYAFIDGGISNSPTQNNNTAKQLTFTTSNASSYVLIRFGVKNSGESITYSNIQLEKGSTATSYEPFVGTPTPEYPIPIESVGDDGAVEVESCGKNLLDPSWFKTYSVTGVDYKNNGDGTFTVSGTATAWAGNASKDFTLFPGTYTISRTAYDSNLNVYIEYKGVKHQGTFTVTEPAVVHMTMQVISGRTVDITFAVQLERSETATAYEPYMGSTATITSGLPLCSVGDVHDELIYNADGTGKIIKRVGIVTLDGSGDENWVLDGNYNRIRTNAISTIISTESFDVLCDKLTATTATDTYLGSEGIAVDTVGNLCVCFSSLVGNSDLTAWTSYLTDNPITVIYQLATPQEIELSAAEMAELMELQTFNGITYIYNDEGAEMSVKIATNPLLSEYVMPVIEGITTRYEARIAALESAIANN